MIKINQVIVVEGKYDKIKLSGFIDGLIITTEGFGVFKDKEKLALIRLMAKKRGIILMTDSDSAGFIIRNFLSQAVKEGQVTHVYIPEIAGKERRKDTASADGLLGVEGVTEQVILDALSKAGITQGEKDDFVPVTKLQMYDDGFYGKQNSAALRVALCKELGLPSRISSNTLPRVISDVYGEKEYKKAVNTIFSKKTEQN